MQKFFLIFVLLLLVFFVTGCVNENASLDLQSAVRDGEGCVSCHGERVSGFTATVHARSDVTCADCHAGLGSHLQKSSALPAIDVYGDTCATCHHEEYTQWAVSPHAAIPLDLFPNDVRVTECVKCHQSSGFLAVLDSGEDFKSARAPYPSDHQEPVTCVGCHGPHAAENTQMLRLPKGETCTTCHGGKWQDLILTGTGSTPYRDYSEYQSHPHHSDDRCVTCHMAKTPDVPLGGHTFAMRTDDGDMQNVGACIACHNNANSYDINRRQSEVTEKLSELRQALEERNDDQLPGNEPGACNQCHRGGSLPFDHDPELILENAYDNYKLVDRDKSHGIHNAPYTLQILRDALESVQNEYQEE